MANNARLVEQVTKLIEEFADTTEGIVYWHAAFQREFQNRVDLENEVNDLLSENDNLSAVSKLWENDYRTELHKRYDLERENKELLSKGAPFSAVLFREKIKKLEDRNLNQRLTIEAQAKELKARQSNIDALRKLVEELQQDILGMDEEITHAIAMSW